MRYKFYRSNSGRDDFIDQKWGDDRHYTVAPMTSQVAPKSNTAYRKPSSAEIKKRLNEIQFQVTQKNGTERPFTNPFWNNKTSGIYVDIVSGEPLFSSTDKFKSGTGWPSFTRPLVDNHVIELSDNKHGWKRVEVRSKHADSHLGHVFRDGPKPTGLRYCINSASLRFIPVDALKEEGLAQYLSLFTK